MNFVLAIASGLFSFFNRVIITGLLGKAILFAMLTWVLVQVFGGMMAAISTTMGQASTLGGALGTAGAVGQMLAWVASWSVVPGASFIVAGMTLRFIIRRLPVVG